MAKRTFDILFAALGLLFLLPLILVIALAIKFDSPGSVLYRGERVGYLGRTFFIRKFRTMVETAEQLGGPSTALNDPRLTRTGRFLRKWKLDELPQLVDVLLGTMSVVGPRPQVRRYTDLYTEDEQRILSLKPGLTDFASIYFVDMDSTLGSVNPDEVYAREIEPIKNKLRLRYVDEQSFLLDLKLVLMTVLRLLGISIWNINE